LLACEWARGGMRAGLGGLLAQNGLEDSESGRAKPAQLCFRVPHELYRVGCTPQHRELVWNHFPRRVVRGSKLHPQLAPPSWSRGVPPASCRPSHPSAPFLGTISTNRGPCGHPCTRALGLAVLGTRTGWIRAPRTRGRKNHPQTARAAAPSKRGTPPGPLSDPDQKVRRTAASLDGARTWGHRPSHLAS
jgi:hypothetical protein